MNVLVTGASGQLGQALKAASARYDAINFYFASSAEADITNPESLETVFNRVKPQYCINAAAYTAVDKAESEPERAFAINATGAKNLAGICNKYSTVLIHISTDFVFDGTKETPYTEEDKTNPKSIYGLTKRDGEIAIQEVMERYFIIRTSWVYSEFANNFMKTMIKLGKERDLLNIVADQTGSPTNANDLATVLIQIMLSGKEAYGIYHFSNEGTASWYDFACRIFKINGINIQANPIPTSAYPTPATRPAYSVLDKSKLKNTFGIEIKNWQESLKPYEG